MNKNKVIFNYIKSRTDSKKEKKKLVKCLLFHLKNHIYLLPEPTTTTKNPDKIDKTMVFKNLNIKQGRTAISERWEIDKVNPTIVMVYCP